MRLSDQFAVGVEQMDAAALVLGRFAFDAVDDV
jgi:hypothetical protein